MKNSRPTPRDIDELVSFLPRLYADGFAPVREWGGGEETDDGGFVMPWPNYQEVVTEFFDAASKDVWMDFQYDPIEAGRVLEDVALVRRASLDEIKTMLTYCVRGERFGEGHWAAMIQAGHVKRLLERLKELRVQGS